MKRYHPLTRLGRKAGLTAGFKLLIWWAVQNLSGLPLTRSQRTERRWVQKNTRPGYSRCWWVQREYEYYCFEDTPTQGVRVRLLPSLGRN